LHNIIVASKNRGKISEIRTILSLPGVAISDLYDIGYTDEIAETGETFEENALIKAKAVFNHCHCPVIADDSGLVVPYLHGEPGVRSARFAGPHATDHENNELLLKRLSEASGIERKAYFYCLALFYTEHDRYFTSDGKVHGRIALEPAGRGGFGYDPLFYVPAYEKTMAQLSNTVKNTISHRAGAFNALKVHITHYVEAADSMD
jgi:XTP/dITP diphosphohydrolase